MKKSEVVTLLWKAVDSGEIADKQEACNAALMYLVGKKGYDALCDIEGKGDDVVEALAAIDEDNENEPNPDMVEALIRQATS